MNKTNKPISKRPLFYVLIIIFGLGLLLTLWLAVVGGWFYINREISTIGEDTNQQISTPIASIQLETPKTKKNIGPLTRLTTYGLAEYDYKMKASNYFVQLYSSKYDDLTGLIAGSEVGSILTILTSKVHPEFNQISILVKGKSTDALLQRGLQEGIPDYRDYPNHLSDLVHTEDIVLMIVCTKGGTDVFNSQNMLQVEMTELDSLFEANRPSK